MDSVQAVGRAFALLRKAKGLNQEDVAEGLGQSRQAVALLESKDGNPTVGRLDRALQAIGCTWFDLAVALRAVEADVELDEVTTGTAAGVGAEELGWLARQLLEAQRELVLARREHAVLREEFERFRDASAIARSRAESAAARKGESSKEPNGPNGPNGSNGPEKRNGPDS